MKNNIIYFYNLTLFRLGQIRLLTKRLFLSCIENITNVGPGVSFAEFFLEIYILFGELYCTFCGRNINLANWILWNYYGNFFLIKNILNEKINIVTNQPL